MTRDDTARRFAAVDDKIAQLGRDIDALRTVLATIRAVLVIVKAG